MVEERKKLKKLKVKHAWPSVMMFCCFVVLDVVLAGMFVQVLFNYSVSERVTNYYKKVIEAAKKIEARLQEGEEIDVIIADIVNESDTVKDIYVIDKEEQPVFQMGGSRPVFGNELDWKLDQTYQVLMDAAYSEDNVNLISDALHIAMDGIIHGVLNPRRNAPEIYDWMHEIVLREPFWMPAPLLGTHYEMYAQCELQFQRRELAAVLLLGLVAIVLLLLPITFMFFNTIRVVIAQRHMTRILYLDQVSGGQNWLSFRLQAERILTQYRNSRYAFAVVDIHLDRYQNYCACYGVKEGESLLAGMESLLSVRMNRRETHARYEGADFALLLFCEGATKQERDEKCYRRVRSLLAELTGINPDQKINVSAGIFCIEPAATGDWKDFRRRKNVDINQYYNYAHAARTQRSDSLKQITYFDSTMLEGQLWDRWVEDTMESALSAGQFEVYLQPKYSPQDARLVGAEALVRWNNPKKGLIPPGKFIPIFEENGFITHLDDYMISSVAKLQAEWTIQGRKLVPVSVNISRAHFVQEGLAEHICQLVDAYGPRHDMIELEVTESAFLDEKDIMVETVRQLKAYGFKVSMDDFGAGYSSLNSLKDIPLDVLKLDGEFFRGEDADGRGQIVVREAIQLARSLDIRVVAEGIEKEEQVRFLASQGCDMIQGYYFAKPMPVDEFMELVDRDA